MSILSTVKKGYMTIKTASGYVKLLPRTLASLVTMDDGTTVQNQITELNSKIGYKVLYAKCISCTYITSTVLQTAVTPSISDLYSNSNNYAVLLTMKEISGTPHDQIRMLKYEIRSGNLLVINALGDGFVSGHRLVVSVVIIECT